MAKKLLSPPAQKACRYCAGGRAAADGTVLCRHKGVMPPDGSCRKYAYDPLKREPSKAPELPKYSPEDFKI